MAGAGYLKTLSLQLAASTQNGVAAFQKLNAAGPLTLNGSLVTGGVATFDVARRVGITSIGNDSALLFTIVGTDYYGRAQTEILAGANAATAQTAHDFKTVTSITSSGATAGNVEAGSTSAASTVPYMIDYFATTANYNAIVDNPGGSTYSIEVSNNDLYPDLNLAAANPTWIAAPNFSGISASGTTAGFIQGPFVMCRLTITAGTGPVSARLAFPLVGGGA